MHLGIVSPLPPAPSGTADYVANFLPVLAARAEITCFTPEPDVVDAHLRERYTVRPLDERSDPAIDVLVYHLGNNPTHIEVNLAAVEGPAGVVVVHDGSLHHLAESITLGARDLSAYEDLMQEAFGARGEQIAHLRHAGQKGQLELFLFDLLGPVLDRHYGALVHSEYAASLVRTRCPGLPLWVVPHYAVAPTARTAKTDLGLPEDCFVMGHFGFVTLPKRPMLLLEAFARVVERHPNSHLLFAGREDSAGLLPYGVEQLGLADHVTVTGYNTRRELEDLYGAADCVVSLRAPHVGESSGTLAMALAAGCPVVVQRVGPWAELPADVAVDVPVAGDEVSGLAAAVLALAADPDRRARMGEAARNYAATELSIDRCADLVLAAAREAVAEPRTPPYFVIRAREAAVEGFLAGGLHRLDTAVRAAKGLGAVAEIDEHLLRYQESLRVVPPARPGERLLDVGAYPAMMRLLQVIWGYEVRGCNLLNEPGTRRVQLPGSGGLPDVTLEVDSVDVERDTFPYETGSFDAVTCWEVLEHLGRDPMHMLCELNRVLRAGGLLVLTTPNLSSLHATQAVLSGGHPYHWAQFRRSGSTDRHQREYTVSEVRRLLRFAGFSDDGVVTQEVWGINQPRVAEVLKRIGARTRDRGDNILAVARKASLPLERYPEEFYYQV
jgi:glycosyltransferase involved in cell wall biosynthesis/SAM-dependent methyltransferase